MKKLNLLIVLGLFCLAGITTKAQITETTEFPITSGADDVEQDLFEGSMYTTSSDIEVTRDGSSEQLIGLRFTDIEIPTGAVINDAYIQVTVDETNSGGPVHAVILVDSSTDAEPWGFAPFSIQNRPYNETLPVIWEIAPWPVDEVAGEDQRTPDLSAQIQSVIDQDGWIAGNAIAFGMVDPLYLEIPGFEGNGDNKRVFETYDNEAATAPRLVINYTLPDIYFNGGFPVDAESSWKYNDQGVDLSGETWTAIEYLADTSWAYGDAKLGYGDGNENTTLNFGPDPDNKYPTTYLRHTFEVSNTSEIDSLIFNVQRDDGVVVYVNGEEAFRMNMPEGEIGYNTLASNAVSGDDEEAFFEYKMESSLIEGVNTIAVELHQSSLSSSDLGFDMSVDFKPPPLETATFPLASQSEWYFLDTGVSLDEDENWTQVEYEEEFAWGQGQGPLGYGNPVNTVVSFGPDPDDKYITTYFRRTIDIDLESLPDSVVFGLMRDDGALVYVNGQEIIRSNMPEGEIDYLTFSESTVSGSAETTFYTYSVSKDVFVDGLNQLAVEVHNRDGFSSDLSFDLYIKEPTETNPPVDCSEPHISCFTSIEPTSQTPNMIISESVSWQQFHKEGTAYTIGDGLVPGNHDFTAFVPVDGSSENGYLSVNHENTPGGVSMIQLSFNQETKLWELNTSQPVDFYNEDLVTTTRNCSGGITPWLTVVTAEETLNSGDVNGDGYEDVGWLVEIDPETAMVMDYDDDGVQDKLWAMGRMSHENVAINNEGTIAYYGEDGGTQCVYKYVTDEPGDLTAGTVYALSLDNPLAGAGDPTGFTGTWVEVPNETQDDRNNMRFNAAALGGTNFNGVEDVEIGTVDGKVYFTSKGNGRVYRFEDGEAGVTKFETFVGGTSYDITTANGVVSESWGGGNDNLTFDDKGNLWVLQDGGNDYIWVVRPDHSQENPNVELFASMPNGSEPCGLTFSPDYRFGFFSVQHPSSSNQPQIDATGNEVSFDKDAVVIFALNGELGTLNDCTADAGSIQFEDGTTETTVIIDDNDPSTVLVEFNEEPSENDGSWVVTDQEGNLLALPATVEDVEAIDFDNAGPGVCLIWFLSFDSENSNVLDLVGQFEAGNDVNANELSGCFDLSNPLTVVREYEEVDCDDFKYYLSDVDVANGPVTNFYEVTLDAASSTAMLTEIASVDYEAHIAFNEDDNLLYVVRSIGGGYRTLDPSSGVFGEEVVLDPSFTKITAAAFNEDGQLIIGDMDSGTIHAIDLETAAVIPYGTGDVSGGDISYGFGGTPYLASRGFSGSIYSINTDGGMNMEVGECSNLVTGMATMSNGNYLLSAKLSGQLTVQFGDFTESTHTYDLLLDDAAFTHLDGDLASGCDDEEVQIAQYDFEAELTEAISHSNQVGLNAEIDENEIGVFPNPTKGELNLVFKTVTTGNTTVEILDTQGKLIEVIFNQDANANQEYRVNFDGSSLPNGIYLYRMVTGNEIIIDKFMIAR